MKLSLGKSTFLTYNINFCNLIVIICSDKDKLVIELMELDEIKKSEDIALQHFEKKKDLLEKCLAKIKPIQEGDILDKCQNFK